jgi:hypothetical protein
MFDDAMMQVITARAMALRDDDYYLIRSLKRFEEEDLQFRGAFEKIVKQAVFPMSWGMW